MKTYTVARSIYGDLGSLKRNQVLNEDDPRIVNNPKAVKELVGRKMLIEGTADDSKSEPTAELSKLTNKQLRELAEAEGIAVETDDNKASLVAKIEAARLTKGD